MTLLSHIKLSILYFIASILLLSCASPKTKAPDIASVAKELEAKKQRQMAAMVWVEMEKDFYRMAYPILEHGVSLCGDKTRFDIGIMVWNRHHFNEDWYEAVQNQYQITNVLKIIAVAPNSPAQQVGLQAGDIPIAINDWDVPMGEKALEKFWDKIADVAKDKQNQAQALTLKVRRDKQAYQVKITPKAICDYKFVLLNSEEKNAHADGENIVMYRGLMEFFNNDEEAALIISHELAHNAMKHIEAKKQNAIMGGIAGFVLDMTAAYYGVNTRGQFSGVGSQMGAMTYSVEFEQEADYVGLYFMALAGYHIDNVANFWRRMAIQNPKSIQLKRSHPTTPERFIAIEKAILEIKHKQENQLPLVPDYE